MINDTCRASLLAGETIEITTIPQKRIIASRQVVEINELKALKSSRERLAKCATKNSSKRRFQNGVVSEDRLKEPLRERRVILWSRLPVFYISLLLLPILVGAKCSPGKYF